MHMNVLPAYIYAYHMCVWCLQRSEEVSDPLELSDKQLEATTWVLGNKPHSFAGAAERVLC